MIILRTPQELRRWREALPTETARSVGFVPTMGALHPGHASLLRTSRSAHSTSVLSIFVNPTQFGPNEDLAAYPRTWDADLEIARAEDVAAVFAPQPGDFYPPDFSTHVAEELVSSPLCGPFRPGHFRGVATVVLKLLNLVQPSHAYFGLKDLQQYLVLQKMVRDLAVPVTLVGCPTLREPDGLAMSSRNRYLSPEEREKAPLLYRELQQIARSLRDGETQAPNPRGLEALTTAARGRLSQQGFSVQYLEVRELPHLAAPDLATPLPEGRTFAVAAAAYLGKTRLIDNLIFGPN